VPTFALRAVSTSSVPRSTDVRDLARRAGMHPDLVGLLLRQGLLDPPAPPRRSPPGSDPAATIARAGRLRRDLGLNYAGAVLACELLEHIEELEARLRRYEG
jgi:hypothetical protein